MVPNQKLLSPFTCKH